MFSRIAPKYDLINRTLSLGMDERVRRKAAALANLKGQDLVLDLATGTAAMALELARRSARVIGVDFSPEMLTLARKKCAHTKIKLIAADAMTLPFRCGPSEAGPSGPFDLVTVAFSLRSMGDVKESLRSIKRALRPGGKIIILEFGMPQNRLIRFLYRIYIRLFVPLIGGLISGKKESYRFLARSILSFSQNNNLKKALETSGFQEVHRRPLASGIAEVYIARKS